MKGSKPRRALQVSTVMKIIVAIFFFVVGWKLGAPSGPITYPLASTNVPTATKMILKMATPQPAEATEVPKELTTKHKAEKIEDDDEIQAAPGQEETPKESVNPNAKYAIMYGRPEALMCPLESTFDYLQIPLKHLPRKKRTSVREKYNRRAHNCAANGIWNKVTANDHYIILEGMQRMAKMKSGAYVFDWGTGCGEKLKFLTEKFNISGFGIDVSDLTIRYAQVNTTKRNHYCVADGTKMEWIPSNYFDHSISFGSVYHVYNRTMFCHVLREMVRITVPGGSVYNGWTENGEYKREHVEPCLGDLPVEIKIFEEREVFPLTKLDHFPLKAQQDTPNTYSLVVFKHKPTTPEHFKHFPISCTTHKCVKV